MKIARIIAPTLLALSISATALAREKDGVTMPDSITVSGKALVLNGMGTREATVLKIDVYVGGLYVEAKSQDGGAIAASPGAKRLVLKFVRDVDRDKITSAWREGFEKNAPGGTAALTDRINRLNGWMTNVSKGQHLTFTYAKDKGVEVNVNGAVKGIIEGDDFARAFFLIWLGPNPPNSGLKKGLLGKE
jgi:hypothetical protein